MLNSHEFMSSEVVPAAVVDGLFEQAGQDIKTTTVTDLLGPSDQDIDSYFGFEPVGLDSASDPVIAAVQETKRIEAAHGYLVARKYVDAEGRPVARMLSTLQYFLGCVGQIHLIDTGDGEQFGINAVDDPQVNNDRSLLRLVQEAVSGAMPSEEEAAAQEQEALGEYENDPHDMLMIWLEDARDETALTNITEEEALAADEDIREYIAGKYTGRWRTRQTLDELGRTYVPCRISPTLFQEAAQKE